MIAAPINHIILDDRGVAYIRATTLKVAHVAMDAELWSMTPRQIQESYPQVSLAQIYAALAYYYDHKEEIDTWIAQETQEYQKWRAEHPNPFTREQLQERGRKRQRDKAAE